MSAVTCPNCGNSVTEQDGRCSRCGKALNNGASASEDTSETHEPSKTFKTVRVIGVLLFFVSVASCSTILYHSTKGMHHVVDMYGAFFGMLFGILLTFCARAFTTR